MAQTILEKENTASYKDDISTYLREIRQYPLLTPEQELEVAKGCARGDEDAIRTMVNSNLRLVVAIVTREYANRREPLLDLIQEGTVGLIYAARKFDHTKSSKFSAYARLWIVQRIDRYLLQQTPVYVPQEEMATMQRIQAVRAALLQENGQEPNLTQIADRCHMPVAEVETLMRQTPKVCSLDVPAGENGEDSMQMLLEDEQALHPYEAIVRQELRSTLEKLLDELTPPRKAQILRLHNGLVDGTHYSFQKIADLLGISKERVRQINNQAFKELQEKMKGLDLEAF